MHFLILLQMERDHFLFPIFLLFAYLIDNTASQDVAPSTLKPIGMFARKNIRNYNAGYEGRADFWSFLEIRNKASY